NEWKRDVTLMTDELEYAAADHIDHKRLRGKIKESNLTYSRDEYAMSLGYKNKETETIIDKWNNTVAFAESVGGIFGFGERENQRNITDDNYNETKIKIFDIEYYNRKTTNK
ncbi:MAG: hypothetical protein H7X71_02685, partial [Chitinophagales bacterium]|nr:hypothetical protein [Chitinophagales bacterium]